MGWGSVIETEGNLSLSKQPIGGRDRYLELCSLRVGVRSAEDQKEGSSVSEDAAGRRNHLPLIVVVVNGYGGAIYYFVY